MPSFLADRLKLDDLRGVAIPLVLANHTLSWTTKRFLQEAGIHAAALPARAFSLQVYPKDPHLWAFSAMKTPLHIFPGYLATVKML